MVQERVEIIVTERGTRVVKRNISDIGGSASSAEGSVRLLNRALGALASAATIIALGKLVDEFTNVQNRLRNVTEGTAQLNAVTEELFNISNRTRLAFGSTAEVFARTALAVKDLGISQEQTLQFTESLNQAVVLSGASASEAQAGLIQLSQGLASGALRGDELRSVLEQLPAVADVISKSLGVTRGELRELGSEGKITADIILKAFGEAREELAEKFGKTVPTIGQAFTVFRNNIVQFVGGLDSSIGASRNFARLILSLAENMEVLGRAVGGVAVAIGVTLATRAIPAAISAVRALTVAAAANPFGAMAIAITAVIGGLVAFGDQITVANGQLATIQDFGIAVWANLTAAVDSFVDFFANNFGFVGEFANETFGGINLTFEDTLLFFARGADSLIGIFSGAFAAIVLVFDDFPKTLQDIFLQAINGSISIVESGINQIIRAVNKVSASLGGESSISSVALGRIENSAAGAASSAGEAAATAFADALEFSGITEAVINTLDDAESIARERISRQRVEATQISAARAGLATPGVNVVGSDPEGTKRQADLLKELEGPLQGLLDRQADLQILFDSGKISLETYNEELRRINVSITELDNSLSGGIANGFARVAEEANNLGSQVSDFVVGAFDSASDAVVEFARTGKLNIREFFADLAAQLLKISTNQLFASLMGGAGGGLGAVGGAAGGGFGSILASSLGGLFGFRDGGSFTVGGQGGPDSQLVAFKASPNEEVSIKTPQQQAATQTTTETPVNVRVINVTDPKEALSAIDTDEGERTITNMIERNASSIRRVLGVT